MQEPVSSFAARQWSPLALAYLGDAVLEINVRQRVLFRGCFRMNQVHREAVRYVRASAQAEAMLCLEPLLSEEEMSIYKRGRNAKAGHIRKNADMTEYRLATGFEALIGYLHLTGQDIRLQQILNFLYNIVEEGTNP